MAIMYEETIQRDKVLKVLHVFNGLNNGGVESFVMNLFLSLKEEQKIRFDFLLRSRKNDDDKIVFFKKAGSYIYITADWPHHILKNYRQTKFFLRNHSNNYDVIHVHVNALVYILPIVLACKYTKKTRIVVHSHNTKSITPFLMPLHYLNRMILKRIHTYNIACSNEAGKWMFKGPFKVVPNGIDVNRYKGKNHAIDESVLRLVSVGRLEKQKNYFFIISVIKMLVDQGMNVIYKIAGEGSLRQEMEMQIKRYGLQNNITILGNCRNVEYLLNEADIFLMPSLYEGLSIAHLEAQCSGIPCILSDKIPKEGCIVKNVYRIPLNKRRWVETIMKISFMDDKEYNRENYKQIENSGFSLRELSRKISEIYGMEDIVND